MAHTTNRISTKPDDIFIRCGYVLCLAVRCYIYMVLTKMFKGIKNVCARNTQFPDSCTYPSNAERQQRRQRQQKAFCVILHDKHRNRCSIQFRRELNRTNVGTCIYRCTSRVLYRRSSSSRAAPCMCCSHCRPLFFFLFFSELAEFI